jgi:hypothetical protein
MLKLVSEKYVSNIKNVEPKHLSLDCYMKISATCKHIHVYLKFSRISG